MQWNPSHRTPGINIDQDAQLSPDIAYFIPNQDKIIGPKSVHITGLNFLSWTCDLVQPCSPSALVRRWKVRGGGWSLVTVRREVGRRGMLRVRAERTGSCPLTPDTEQDTLIVGKMVRVTVSSECALADISYVLQSACANL